MRRHVPTGRRLRRAVFVGAVVVGAGSPLAAHAIDTPLGSAAQAARTTSTDPGIHAEPAVDVPAFDGLTRELAAEPTDDADRRTIARLSSDAANRVALTPDVRRSRTDRNRVAEPTVDPTVAVLAETYVWDETSPRVERLQWTLGIAVDGTYGVSTRAAHVGALTWLGLPTDGVPLPAGPDPSAWAALRDCESGGDYAIASRSGKYRGAYQFDRSTWNSLAARHAPALVGVDPAAASPADQDLLALMLWSERSARPWPHCGRHLR